MEAYRRDNRSVGQFARDIKDGTNKEKAIMIKYADMIRRRGYPANIINNGCDNSGSWQPDYAINTKADFLLNGSPVEVKFANRWNNVFHFKIPQIESYIRQHASVLFVNGYETSNPQYTFISEAMLEYLAETHKPIPFDGWGGKLCYEFLAAEFKWESFR